MNGFRIPATSTFSSSAGRTAPSPRSGPNPATKGSTTSTSCSRNPTPRPGAGARRASSPERSSTRKPAETCAAVDIRWSAGRDASTCCTASISASTTYSRTRPADWPAFTATTTGKAGRPRHTRTFRAPNTTVPIRRCRETASPGRSRCGSATAVIWPESRAGSARRARLRRTGTGFTRRAWSISCGSRISTTTRKFRT